MRKEEKENEKTKDKEAKMTQRAKEEKKKG